MSLKVFPTALFGFETFDPDLELGEISGGTSISGAEDIVATDGGGRWTLNLSEPFLDEPDYALAWDALSSHLSGGTPIIVPLTDARNQMMGTVTLPIGGLPWWEEADFGAPVPRAVVVADAPLRATSLSISNLGLPKPIRPGQRFSIDHSVHRHRAYRVLTVSSGTLTFAPPLREAVTAGSPVEFVDPKCVMRKDGSMRAPRSHGFASGSDLRFVEHFPGPGGYE